LRVFEFTLSMREDQGDLPPEFSIQAVTGMLRHLTSLFPRMERLTLGIHGVEGPGDRWLEMGEREFPGLLEASSVVVYRVERRGGREQWVTGERGSGGCFRVTKQR
jgi:hypothetical protein